MVCVYWVTGGCLLAIHESTLRREREGKEGKKEGKGGRKEGGRGRKESV